MGAVGLARMLIAGNGVDKVYNKAFHYLSQARKGHLAEVYRNLGMLQDTGKGGSQDFRKTKRMYLSAIVKGDRMAFFPAGVIFKKNIPQKGMATPLTTEETLASVLDEQCEIATQADIQALLEQIKTTTTSGQAPGQKAGNSLTTA